MVSHFRAQQERWPKAAGGAGLFINPEENQIPHFPVLSHAQLWAGFCDTRGLWALTNPALQAGTGSRFHHVWGVHAHVEAQN